MLVYTVWVQCGEMVTENTLNKRNQL